ncbi:hypothetical protein AC249_AIPGENE16756 [Exaiptasia diaphana]|nr:hypothetical protein AC249_AIPGENE16756 [Exaiptasia diaphana]
MELMSRRSKEYKSYQVWLAGITEQINASLHPDFPGRWYRIDLIQVPVSFFKHMVTRLDLVLDSVKYVSHKRPPVYSACAQRLSYKGYTIENVIQCIGEQHLVQLKRDAFYSGYKEVVPTEVSLDEEIEAAMEYNPYDVTKIAAPRDFRISSLSTIEIGEGIGRATREIEVIWWPQLYEITNHGHMTLRYYVSKSI